MAESKVRSRVPWLKLFGVVLVFAFTMKDAVVNMLAPRPPTKQERLQQDQQQQIQWRRARLTTLTTFGDHCDVRIARDLARTLAFDDQPVTRYADDFARRCGDDVVVRKWATLMDRRHQLREARAPVAPVRAEAAL